MAVDQVRIGEDLVEYFKLVGINDRKIREYITQPTVFMERLFHINYEFYEKRIENGKS